MALQAFHSVHVSQSKAVKDRKSNKKGQDKEVKLKGTSFSDCRTGNFKLKLLIGLKRTSVSDCRTGSRQISIVEQVGICLKASVQGMHWVIFNCKLTVKRNSWPCCIDFHTFQTCQGVDPNSNPVRSTRTCYEFFPSQKCCADSLLVCPTPSVYTHAQGLSRTSHVKSPEVTLCG